MKYILIILLFFCTCISMISFNFFIKHQIKKRVGQSIRGLGPETHLIKSGTPTMGGILLIFNTILIYFIFCLVFKKYLSIDIFKSILILFPLIGFGVIGFIDDFLIIKKHNNIGLKPTHKFLLELFVSAVYYFIYLINFVNNELNFFGTYIDLGFMYGVMLLLLLSGFTNATNFTDGLDGLLGLNGIISFLFIGIYSYLINNYHVLLISIIVIFVLISFLSFNLPKATIFMGDTGSLALGGLMISSLVSMNAEVLILFFGFIYFVEIFSVILQVWYFKKTKGQRIFKMSPLHHHFEICGLSEMKINLLFCFINFVFSSIGLWIGISFL